MKKLTRYGLLTVLTLALALGVLPMQTAQLPVAEANPGTQWNASYFNNRNLSGSPVVTRIDDAINFNWAGGSPDAAVPADNFSARWTKTVNFPVGGTWNFRVGADDGVRMWVDSTLIVDQWHGTPAGYTTYTATLGALTAGPHDLKVEYYEDTGFAGVQVTWEGPGGTTPAQPVQATPTSTWNGQYWNNATLSGSPVVTRVDNALNFQWGNGSPDAAVPADNFSARWTTVGGFAIPGWWRFTVTVDGGVRVWVDSTLIIDKWTPQPGVQTYFADLYELTAGSHEVRVEYWDDSGNAQVRIHWEAYNPDGTPRGDGSGGGTGQAAGDPAVKVWASVTATTLNVRSGPGTGHPVIAQVQYPKNYIVRGAVPDMSWVLIDLKDGREGWVSNEWVYLWAADSTLNEDADGDTYQDFVFKIPRINVEVLPGKFTPVDKPLVPVKGRVNDNLNLRDGPTSFASQVIGTVPVGSIVDIEARNRNGAWYLVDYQGIRGWLSAAFVSLTEGRVSDLLVSTEVVPVPPAGQVFFPADEQGNPAVTVRGRALSNLVFRNNATLTADEIGRIPQDAEFVIEARNRNGAWYLITYEGQPGWVNAAFVRLIEGRVADLRIQ
ncbi:MAG TPA: PA14 domain-containing protein [Aggregatilineaceae bacterium]|nr:SH3 domain-containing protein [Anaerolineae bacterium]HMM29120.1 PA14 domain-containing protein [Aggregatilineaceae bacterium]